MGIQKLVLGIGYWDIGNINIWDFGLALDIDASSPCSGAGLHLFFLEILTLVLMLGTVILVLILRILGLFISRRLIYALGWGQASLVITYLGILDQAVEMARKIILSTSSIALCFFSFLQLLWTKNSKGM